MKELKFTITGTIFVPDNVEYEYNYEDQIYSIKINDKTYVLIAGLEADEKEIIVTDENFKSHSIGFFEYEGAYFETTN
jgi:hypothetical protein